MPRWVTTLEIGRVIESRMVAFIKAAAAQLGVTLKLERTGGWLIRDYVLEAEGEVASLTKFRAVVVDAAREND